MNIILDANILIGALIRDSHIRRLIILSNIPLLYPEIMLHEIRKYKEVILQKSGIDEESYDKLLAKLLGYITLIPTEQLKEHLPEAKEIMKDIDIKDAPFIAAALACEDPIIWSDDAHFKMQKLITAYTTTEITKIILANQDL
ncbi:PIN domain-containing protein [Candidatus Woesearchaeota archaeon]|nr:PIN domain-containing protein [Candidatus Woesearchaeota archaeon]